MRVLHWREGGYCNTPYQDVIEAPKDVDDRSSSLPCRDLTLGMLDGSYEAFTICDIAFLLFTRGSRIVTRFLGKMERAPLVQFQRLLVDRENTFVFPTMGQTAKTIISLLIMVLVSRISPLQATPPRTPLSLI